MLKYYFEKDNMIITIFFFIITLSFIKKLNITNDIFKPLIITIIIFGIYNFYKNKTNNNILEKHKFLNNYIDNNYFNNHNIFIDFIYKNKRFKNFENYKDLINSINIFLKYFNQLNTKYNSQNIDNCMNMYENSINNYESCIYLLPYIDNNFQTNKLELETIFQFYIQKIKTIQKHNNNNIHNKAKLHDEYILAHNN